MLFNEEGKANASAILLRINVGIRPRAKKSDKEGQANSPAILLRLRAHLLVHEEERQREQNEFTNYFSTLSY